jgi:prepilin-type processing-associated H-X9-DG protein
MWCNSALKAPCAQGNTDRVQSQRSYHPGVVNSLFADGSVHVISDGVNLATYQSLGTRAGNETPGDL